MCFIDCQRETTRRDLVRNSRGLLEACHDDRLHSKRTPSPSYCDPRADEHRREEVTAVDERVCAASRTDMRCENRAREDVRSVCATGSFALEVDWESGLCERGGEIGVRGFGGGWREHGTRYLLLCQVIGKIKYRKSISEKLFLGLVACLSVYSLTRI